MLTQEIIQNLQGIQEKINQACKKGNYVPERVKIIAVTKTFPIEAIAQVLKLGIGNIGENRIQEALPKIEKINQNGYKNINWHLIGHLQTNKVTKAVQHFDLIHSVDSLKLCQKISQYALSQNRIQDILFEVNTSGELSKQGFSPGQLLETFPSLRLCKGVRILGLMTVAQICDKQEQARSFFKNLRELRDKIQSIYKVVLPELSMGMSDDYAIAIEEGATMVRLGRAIFGHRG